MKRKKVKKEKEKSFLQKLHSLYIIDTDKALLVRQIWLPCLAIIYVIISYFIVNPLIGVNNFSDGIKTLINVDLALFALQIASFTLFLSPYKKLQNQIKRRKEIYIREIEKDRSLYDPQILKKFDETISFNVRKFRFETYCILVLLINFAISLFVGITTFASNQIRISFLFANMINQLIAFVHFLMMSCSIFSDTKKEVEANIEVDKDYLTRKLKVSDTHKTNEDRHEICCKIERIAREEDDNG